MNETLQNIFTRRSIRKYKNENISDELLNQIIEAAMYAPSACNQQPWHFIVITDKAILTELSQIHGGMTQLKNAPLAIGICGEPGITKLEYYWQQDCAFAAHNIMLAANSLGVGTSFMGINPYGDESMDTVKRILKLAEGIVPFSIIALGYPDETRKAENRFKAERIHKQTW